MKSIEAVLFDVDGTLVDSNREHVTAWQHAFADHGEQVAAERIEREPEVLERQIGKGGKFLVRAILGPDVPDHVAERLGAAESDYFQHYTRLKQLPLIPGARALLAAVRERKLRLALATSSSSEQIDALMKSTGVDLRELVDVTIGADDVARAKPHPDPLLAAAHALAVEPARCLMIGDTLHDTTAAGIAGVVSIGVATWVWSTDELIAEGSCAAWTSPAELLRELDRAFTLAAAAGARLSAQQRASA